MKYLFYSFYFIALTTTSLAQSNSFKNKIDGVIINETPSPIEFANVTLHKATDSALVKATITDTKGFFEFEGIMQGNYFIRISHAGYQLYWSKSFLINTGDSTFSFKNIQLKNNLHDLKNVTVQGFKPLIERKSNKLIINIENSIISSGGTAIEVLESAPGIIVDQNGQISINGKPKVLVMVDGKIIADNLLKTLSSNIIEKIEIIAHPSTSYDAAGSGGIVNIRLKKDQKLGLNGTLMGNYGQGVYEKTNNSLNLNYRNKKWNFFTNYAFSFRRNFQNIYNPRKLLKNGKLFNIYDQINYIVTPTTTHTIRIGTDYFLSKSTTIGIMADGNFSHFNKTGDNQTSILDSNNNAAGRFTTGTLTKDHWQNMAINLNIKHLFNDKGKEINIDLNGATYKSNTTQHFITHYYNVTNVLTKTDTLIGPYNGYIDLYSVKIDYNHPIGQNAKIEMGAKSSFVKTDNNVTFFNRKNNVDVFDTINSNHFRYTENINAGYITYNYTFKNGSIELGLRGEQTVADGLQLTNGETFHKNYFQIFPSISINHKISPKHEFNYSFSKRINRPNYQQLNPFKLFYDPSTFDEGNPSLLPEISHSVEISHTYNERITTTIEYAQTKNSISAVVLQDAKDPKRSILAIRNIESSSYYSLGVYTPIKIFKWWSINNNFSVNHLSYNGNLVNTVLKTSRFAFQNSMIHTMALPKNWSAELNFMYISTNIHPLGLYQSRYVVSMGIQKNIMQRKGTLRLNVRDLFYSNRILANTKFANIDEIWQQYTDSRIINLSFTYRFGKKTVTATRKRQTGLESEQDRIQNNN